jgi:uncharacterized membrane protein YsdA (DUF1294 family)/cold shock CspA family protein
LAANTFDKPKTTVSGRAAPDISDLTEGTLVFWNDDKGFGFVRPVAGGDDYFVHISVFDKRLTRRPEIADRVFYREATDTPGKKRLSYAVIKGADLENKRIIKGILTKPRSPYVNFLIILPLLLSSYLIWLGNNPLPFISYVFLSILTIILYGYDKQHAITGQWRIPEIYMHVLELMGGWPGALMGQNDFSHKTRKSAYRRRLWLIIALHGVVWTAYLASKYWKLA